MIAEPRQGQKPTIPVEDVELAQGLEAAPPPAEVQGHTSTEGTYWTCWCCGKPNWVADGRPYFRCRGCGSAVISR
jgi:DNA-directed RNA polymerase subunit RPC12/RpoP